MAIDLLVGAAQHAASAAARTGSVATGLSGGTGGAAGGAGSTVASGFSRLLDGVEQSAADANQAVSAMVDKTGDVHDAMIALQRAEMSLELTVQIRNKFVQAYQDIMRMPI